MRGHGQGFNRTLEGKLFKLSESNFNQGTPERLKRLIIKNRYNMIKFVSDFGAVLSFVESQKSKEA